MTKKELATTKETLPAFLAEQEGPARGSEQAGMDDIIIPRLLLLQQLSPQIDSSEEDYVEGAKAGNIINNVTGHVYGDELTIIPVFFRKEWLIWKDRKKGGGFFGSFSSASDAHLAMNDLEPPHEDYEVTDTATQFVLVCNEDGSLDQAILSMSKTKLACSRKLQSLIRMTERDSFANKYTLSSVAAKSDLGKYFNFSVRSLGFVSEEEFYAAEACYQAVSADTAKYKAVEPEKESF